MLEHLATLCRRQLGTWSCQSTCAKVIILCICQKEGAKQTWQSSAGGRYKALFMLFHPTHPLKEDKDNRGNCSSTSRIFYLLMAQPPCLFWLNLAHMRSLSLCKIHFNAQIELTQANMIDGKLGASVRHCAYSGNNLVWQHFGRNMKLFERMGS